MAARSPRWIAIGADGLAAGVILGLVQGSWTVALNHDLAHRMFVLAASRLAVPVLTSAYAMMTLSLVLASAVGAYRHAAARVARRRMVAAVGAVVVGIAAAGFPLREGAFPLHYFSSPWVTASIGVIAVAVILVLAARRFADVAPITHEKGAAVPGSRLGRGRRALHLTATVTFVVAGAVHVGLPAFAHPAASVHSVLIVSIDTLRADRLGVLGSRRDLTPGLDRLAREGVLFTAAESAAPWTLPSHASLFTSQLPGDHRVQRISNRIPPAQVMLAEHFADAGYRTAAFTAGGYLTAWYGFAQGFRTFTVFPYADGVETDPIVDAALRWIGDDSARPFFAFVHTYAPHVPYRHAEVADAHAAGRLGGEFSFRDLEAIRSGALELTPTERRYVTDLYDGGVAYADRALGRLFDELRRRALLDHMIVVVLSDHGEDLWDHVDVRSPDHGHSLYEELTHVPLLVRAPGIAASGVRIDRPVSLLDVAPTVLDLAGLPADPAYAGIDLAPSCRSSAAPPIRAILSESTDVGPERFAARLGDAKLIFAPDPGTADGITVPRVEVFDLATDPQETGSGRSAVAPGALLALLETRATGASMVARATSPTRVALPPDLSERLRVLGYTR